MDKNPFLEKVSETFRSYLFQSTDFLPYFLWGLFLAFLLLFLGYVFYQRYKKKSQSLRLFYDLSRLQNLTDEETQCLQRVAWEHRLSEPAVLFLRKSLLEHAPDEVVKKGSFFREQLIRKLFT